MPEWNPRANDLFVQAAEIDSPADRRLFLEQQCGGDAALQSQVESLLMAGGKIGSFLERPAVPVPPPDDSTAAYRPLTEGPGTVIGPYKLLQHIGEGGFGAVYMAEQEHPVRRKVALKIIKLGMDTREVIARFESERQALAMMEHPNIARVFDAGATESGRPYFVMELVRGVPITEFCDKNRFSAEQRLKLFVTVCNAIQHAHHKGIIHRDIKPSNVMVTLHDGVPVVKVIDFGVAKATAQKLTERTLFTAYGQMIGTPAYMSPEQAEMSGLDIDMRSDIFSLGVLLYELLTGTTPLDSGQLRKAGYAEMQRLIREEEAPRPSTRFSSLGGEATVLATNRGTDAKRLSQLLRSDLDWIVMKALEKDRNRRYGSPANFAADVERYLKDEAVEACPPTLSYRLRKSYRRNKGPVLAGSAFATLLTVGVVAASWLAIRASVAERKAADDRDAALLAEQHATDQRNVAEAAGERLRQSLYASDMQLASSFWRSNDRKRTLEVLGNQIPAAGEPDPRGFEWHYLNGLCRNSIRTLTVCEGTKLVTPNGKRLYVLAPGEATKPAGGLRTIRRWDLTTGAETADLKIAIGADNQRISIERLSQNGDRLLVGVETAPAKRGDVIRGYKVFDTETGKELSSLADGLDPRSTPRRTDRNLRFLATSKDGRGNDPLLVAPTNFEITLWNIDTQTVVRKFSLPGQNQERFEGIDREFSVHPEGRRIAAIVVSLGKAPTPSDAAGVYQLRVWDVNTGEEVQRVPLGNSLSRIEYTPDGNYIVEAPWDGNVVHLRSAENGRVVIAFQMPTPAKGTGQKLLRFSPDGSLLAVNVPNQTGIYVWPLPKKGDVLTSTHVPPVRTIPTDNSAVTPRVWFTADSRSLVLTTSTSKIAPIHDLYAPAVTLEAPTDWPTRSAEVFTPRKFNENELFFGTALVVSPPDARHGRLWALWEVGTPDKPQAEVRMWDVAGREVFRVRFDSMRDRYTATVSHDGKRFIVVQTPTLAPDRRKAVARVQVWDLETQTELEKREIADGTLRFLGAAPDGNTLAVSRATVGGAANGLPLPRSSRLSLWDLANNREIHGVDCPGWAAHGDLSLDGTRMAWVVSDPTTSGETDVRTWDTKTGRELWKRRDFGKHGFSVECIPEYSRDGKVLLVAANSTTAGECVIYVLDAETGRDLRPPMVHKDGRLSQLRISPDRKRLFALSDSGPGQGVLGNQNTSAVVWDLETGRNLLTLADANTKAMSIDREGGKLYLVKQGAAGNLVLETRDGTSRAESPQ